MTQTVLDIRGIGPAMQIVLAKHGFVSVADLANSTVDKLIVTPGISEIKAKQVIVDAAKLIASLLSAVKSTKTTTKAKNKTKKTNKKTNKKAKQDKIKDKKGNKDKKKNKQKSKKSKKESK